MKQLKMILQDYGFDTSDEHYPQKLSAIYSDKAKFLLLDLCTPESRLRIGEC